jgi:hypothetical protein
MLSQQIVMLALALATTMLVGVGCGGSSKTSSSVSSTATTASQTATTGQATNAALNSKEITIASGKPLSHAAWIAKGDAICAATNVKLSSTTAKNTHDFARLLPQTAAYERIEAAELSKLVPPTSKADDWKRILAELQKFAEFSEKAGEYARVNNFKAATPVAQAGNNAQRELVAIAKRDGFKICSVP